MATSNFDFGNPGPREDIEEENEEDDEDVVEEQEDDIGYELHDNVARDLVKYSRSCIAKNEQQLLLTTYGYLTGLMENPHHFISGVIIGTSSSGKTKLQKEVVELFPDEWLYEFTTGSDQTLAYDESWDDALIASLDEMNKPSEDVIEILKSLHGGDEKFTRRVLKDWREGEVENLERHSKPYWFLYAQYDSDFELWNRLLKVPVHEGKAKNRAVLRLQFDHHNVSFGDSNHEYDFEFSEGTKALKEHIRGIHDEFPDGAWVKIPAGEDEFGGFDVAEVVEPIFDVQRSEVNRVSAMVANLIRASALMNYKNREQRKIHVPNEGVKNAIIAEPEDVANILACRDILAATTHELDRKKQAICTALQTTGGGDNRADIPAVMEKLRQTNAPIVKRSQVEKLLDQMVENYLIEKHPGTGTNGRNEYEFAGWHNLGRININNDFKKRFSGVEDPIEGENFIELVRDQNENLEPGPSDFIGSTEVGSSGKDKSGQVTLTSDSIDLTPYEETIRGVMHDNLDGEVLDISEREPSYYEMLGVTPLGQPPDDPDVEGTVFDPEHEIWNMPETQGWARDEDEAFNAIDDVLGDLNSKGVFTMTPTEKENGQPVKVRVDVKSEDEL